MPATQLSHEEFVSKMAENVERFGFTKWALRNKGVTLHEVLFLVPHVNVYKCGNLIVLIDPIRLAKRLHKLEVESIDLPHLPLDDQYNLGTVLDGFNIRSIIGFNIRSIIDPSELTFMRLVKKYPPQPATAVAA